MRCVSIYVQTCEYDWMKTHEHLGKAEKSRILVFTISGLRRITVRNIPGWRQSNRTVKPCHEKHPTLESK
jgi:hypothetical protein